MRPSVSVLIASHRSRLLPNALQSVWNQTLSKGEVQLLVNFCEHPSNFLTAWNELALIATGKYLCILGDDDTFEPTYLAECMERLDLTQAQIAYSNVRIKDAHGKTLGTYVPPIDVTLESMREGNKIWASSLVSREMWMDVGGYDMTNPYVHDYDFWVRCLQHGARTVYVPYIGWNYTEHDYQRITTSVDRHYAMQLFDEKHPGFRLHKS